MEKKLVFSFKWLVLCNPVSFVLYILVSLPSFFFSFIKFGGPSVHFFFLSVLLLV